MNMEAENMKNIFGERLKEIRNANNMSQSELANYLDITPSSLSYYENGVRNPPITILTKLVERFNVSVNWLLGINENQNMKLRTYADMIKHILPLLNYSDIWSIEFYDADLPFDNVIFNGLKTDDENILKFLNAYKQMENLTRDNSVPKDILKNWIDGALQELDRCPRPLNKSETNDQ